MTQLHLLQKTELKIAPISLQQANLNDIAHVVADTLGIDRKSVMVTDVRDEAITLDVFLHRLDSDNLLGKQEQLMERLAHLPGVGIGDNTSLTSDGVLGWIALDEGKARRALERTQKMAEEIQEKLSRRAIVFSTGTEVATGQIKDTNTPAIAARLTAEGYSVTQGETLGDDEMIIAGKLRQAIFEHGHRLIIITGGVGAEDKDFTIEAVLQLDPDAATPYISRYEKGTGRHTKDGVRIAVGRVFDAIIVALPGPNDEVRASLDELAHGLKHGLGKWALADAVANILRSMLRDKVRHHEYKETP